MCHPWWGTGGDPGVLGGAGTRPCPRWRARQDWCRLPSRRHVCYMGAHGCQHAHADRQACTCLSAHTHARDTCTHACTGYTRVHPLITHACKPARFACVCAHTDAPTVLVHVCVAPPASHAHTHTCTHAPSHVCTHMCKHAYPACLARALQLCRQSWRSQSAMPGCWRGRVLGYGYARVPGCQDVGVQGYGYPRALGCSVPGC